MNRPPRRGASRTRRCTAVRTVLLVAVLATGAACSLPGSDSEPAPAATGRPSASVSPTPKGPAGTPAPAPAPLRRFYTGKPSWHGCGDGFECATVAVPVDYARPATGDVSLSVVRLPATDRGRRLGSLLLNPGGPGVGGISYARAARSAISASVRERFDIVGFDPRGVATSDPVDCVDDPTLDRILATDGSPDDAAEERELLAVGRELGRGCARDAPRLVGHVATRDVARDLDVLRAVLGDDRLHYLGKSYGTLLGATYAELFPGRVGRLVLDGAVDPSLDGVAAARAQAAGFERALAAFVDDCLERRDCPLDGPRAAALDSVTRLLDGIDRRPLPTRLDRPLTQALAILGVAASLYDDGSWPVLRRALREAARGDGTTLLLLADLYTDRNEAGRFTSNAAEALYAITCLDRPERADLAAFERQARDFAAASPRFGAYLAWGSLPCATWPVPAVDRPHRVRASGAAPILVLGTLRDPATPFEQAESLAAQLESGVLLAWDGDGHLAYGRGSRCVDDAVDTYLLTGRTPPDGTRCP